MLGPGGSRRVRYKDGIARNAWRRIRYNIDGVIHRFERALLSAESSWLYDDARSDELSTTC